MPSLPSFQPTSTLPHSVLTLACLPRLLLSPKSTVRCYGTETRVQGHVIPPIDKTFDFVVIDNKDIRDLHVHSVETDKVGCCHIVVVLARLRPHQQYKASADDRADLFVVIVRGSTLTLCERGEIRRVCRRWGGLLQLCAEPGICSAARC